MAEARANVTIHVGRVYDSCTAGVSTGIEDQVQCTVRYRDGILANMYHGFHQPARMDRQEMRFVFERGDLTLHEWVPTRVFVRAVADEAATRQLCELFPRSRLDVTHLYSGHERACRGRHKPIDVFQMFEMACGSEIVKYHRYGELLRSMVRDQVAWIRDRGHQRRITEDNGRASLMMAIAADRLAHSRAQTADG